MARNPDNDEEIIAGDLDGGNAAVEDPENDDVQHEEKPILTAYDKFIAKLVEHCRHLCEISLESHFISEGTSE